jgi:hypothetical protein
MEPAPSLEQRLRSAAGGFRLYYEDAEDIVALLREAADAVNGRAKETASIAAQALRTAADNAEKSGIPGRDNYYTYEADVIEWLRSTADELDPLPGVDGGAVGDAHGETKPANTEDR